jgi:rubrerythrin
MAGWTLDDIPWAAFDPARVDPAIVPLVKAASMVESNAADYRTYLNNVFADDDRVKRAVDGWAKEEEQHGAALARWAVLADPQFDYDTSFRAFTAGYRIPLGAAASVRGSRAGEMVARCMVETGTNSFYTALAEATAEPVLKAICRRIADDELAHYWMFHRHMRRYLNSDGLGLFARLRIALGRIAESEDDELAYAFYAANAAQTGEAYDRRRHGGEYQRLALAYYTPSVVRNAVALVFSAVGLDAKGLAGRAVTRFACWLVKRRHGMLARRLAASGRGRDLVAQA